VSDILNVLFLGDVVGRPGCRALFIGLKTLSKKYNSDLVIVNGENAAEGFGITPVIADQFFTSGVDIITTGNHIWQKEEILTYMSVNPRILRPENYPDGAPGKGYCTYKVKGFDVAVINLQGRVRMMNLNCPFIYGRKLVKKLKKNTNIIIVDFHAEDPEEKESLGMYLDGLVTAVLGTHTHVQTGDERIMPGGTAYISDVGMIGPVNSVIGFDKNIALKRSLTQMPLKMVVAENPAVINGVFLQIDTATGKAKKIERIWEMCSV